MTGMPQQEQFAGAGVGAGNRGSLLLAVAFLLLALLVLSIPFTTYALDMAMTLALVAIPMSYGFLRQKVLRFDYFEIIYPISILFFLYYGFSTLYLKQNVMVLQYRSLLYWLTPALALALVGYIAMVSGYLTLGRRTRPSAFANLVPSGMAFYLLVGGIGFMGQLANAAQERSVTGGRGISGILSIGQQLSLLFFFGWFLLWYMHWSKRLDKIRKNVLFALYVPAALVIMYAHVGSKEKAIIMVALPTVAFWYARRKLPWKTILAVVLITIFVIFPVYNTFRSQDKRLDTARRLDRTFDVATRWNESGFLDQSLRAFFKRMAIVTSVAAVLKNVPDHVDYRHGDTLLLAPIGLLVPRFLWPDKPVIGIGREFGTTFQLVSSVDKTTRIAPSLISEFYWNFGFPAVVIGMFLVGGCYRFVYQKFGTLAGFDPMRKGIYILLFLRLIHLEGSFGSTLGVVVKGYVILHILIVVSKKIGLLGEMTDVATSVEPA